MQEYISQNLTAIILAIIALFAVGIVITIRFVKKSNKNSFNDNSNKVTQRDNVVKGDMAGRDINKK